MAPGAQFVLSHGYAALFVWVLLSQLGLPLPAAPMLIAVGALVASHRNPFTSDVARRACE